MTATVQLCRRSGFSHTSGQRARSVTIPLATMLMFMSVVVHSAPLLSSDTGRSSAGYFQLHWSDPGQAETGPGIYELEQRGRDHYRRWRVEGYQSFAVTGLPNGRYQYRVRAAGTAAGAWSEPIGVTVQHHSLARAFTLFGAGAMVFFALLAVIFVNRKN